MAQVAIDSKQNEITAAAPTLLSYIDLGNKVVLGDALHTQRQLSIQIGKAGGNYIWTVKGNQPQLLQDLQDWFVTKVVLLPGMGCPPKDFRSATVTSKGHGRIEVRTLTTRNQLNDFLDWPFLQHVFKLERQIILQKTEKTRPEVVFGVTSLVCQPKKLLLISYCNACALIGKSKTVCIIRAMLLSMKIKRTSSNIPLPYHGHH